MRKYEKHVFNLITNLKFSVQTLFKSGWKVDCFYSFVYLFIYLLLLFVLFFCFPPTLKNKRPYFSIYIYLMLKQTRITFVT